VFRQPPLRGADEGTVRLSSITRAVSEMSRLVTPQCTNEALPGSGRRCRSGDERDNGVADARVARERRGVELLRACGAGDGHGRACRNDSESRWTLASADSTSSMA
jgi:hypothetical protein